MVGHFLNDSVPSQSSSKKSFNSFLAFSTSKNKLDSLCRLPHKTRGAVEKLSLYGAAPSFSYLHVWVCECERKSESDRHRACVTDDVLPSLQFPRHLVGTCSKLIYLLLHFQQTHTRRHTHTCTHKHTQGAVPSRYGQVQVGLLPLCDLAPPKGVVFGLFLINKSQQSKKMHECLSYMKFYV